MGCRNNATHPRYHGENKLIFRDDDEVHFVLDQHASGCSVGQANLDGPWPRQNVLERKRSFYPRLYIPVQGNYD
jgi:hypothetical protein